MRANFIGLRRQIFLALLASALSFPANAQFVADTEYNAQAGLATIHADIAYNLGLSGQGVKVGVVDTGINPNHSEFTGAISAGYDFILGSSTLTDTSTFHGSHVAGIIGARRDGVGMQGVAYNSSLIIGRAVGGTNNRAVGGKNNQQVASAMDFTVANGARVMNNSWGFDGFTIQSFKKASLGSQIPSLILSSKNAVANDTVVVFSAGNDNFTQPGIMAGLPYYYPELQPNWIAVIATDVSGTIRSGYSNSCGVSKTWCISAPGGNQAPSTTAPTDAGIYSVNGSGNSSYKFLNGTSMAAPMVTGAVALVAERFPWMTGAQLTSTILTTGSLAAAPHDVYGRGLLDVGKAVKGPGILEFAWTANTQGSSSTWSNNISGTGSLTKSGTGTLTLSGANTYSGGTTVAGGTLSLGSNTAAGTGSITTTGSVIDYANGIMVANAIVINSNTTQLQALTGVTATQSGVISETGGARPLEKIGTGTLILTAANTYSGGTTISAGTLQIGAGGTVGAITGNVTDNATLAFNRSDSVTFAGVVSGTGALTQAGTGTLILTGANTYSGGTTISAGTLQIGSGGTTGSISGNVTNNATLAFNHSDSVTFAGVVSGTGALTKSGAGTLTLSGANTYSGTTTISAGTFILSGSGTIANSSGVANAGTFDISATTSGALITSLSGAGGVTLGSKTLTLTAGAGVYSGVVSGTGGLTFNGTGSETISGINLYTGATTIGSGATLALSGAGSIATSSGVANAGTFDISATTLGTLIVSLSGAGSIVLGAKTLTITNGSGNYTGNVNDGGAGGSVVILKGTQTLTGSNTYSGGTTIGVNSTLVLASPSSLGAGTVTFQSGSIIKFSSGGTYSQNGFFAANAPIFDTNANTVTWTGQLTGPGDLAVTGAGTLILTNATNTYAGGTAVYGASALQVDADGELGAVAPLQLGDATTAGTLRMAASFNLNGSRTVTLNLGGGTIDTQAFSTTVSQTIGGTGALTKMGTGTLILTGTNTYTGGTTISAGTLQIGGGSTTGSISGNVTDNGTLAFNRSDSVTFAGTVSGTGALTQAGTGTLILTGANTYSGGTTISAGTLQIGSGGTTGSISGNVTNNAILALNRSDSVTFAGAVSGTGALTQAGTGTTILTGANTYGGGTTVTGGLINFTALGNFGTGNITINGGGLQWGAGTVLDVSARLNSLGALGGTFYTNGNTVTLASGISGTGALTKSGAGTLTLTGANTYSGGTTISAGTLQIGSGGTTGSTAGNITNNATLIFNRSDDITFGGVISGTGSLTRSGAGTLTLSGANTYSGATTINAGTLSVNGSIVSSVTVASGGTLNGSGTVGSSSISNGATIAPGNSIGLLTMNGNVSFAAGSIYEVEVNNTGQADRLNATGAATINGGTVHVLTQVRGYTAANTYTILSATGGVAGTFNNVIVDNSTIRNLFFMNGSVGYTSSVASLTIEQIATFKNIARTPNEISSATAMQTGGVGGSELYIAILNSTSDANAQAAFDAASGETHATLLAGQFENAALTRRTVLNRMRAKQGHEAGWSLWGNVSGDWGSIDGDGNAAYTSRSGVNITAGSDTSLDENWRGGFEGGFSSNQLNVAARASGTDLQSGHIGAYAYGRYDAVALRVGGSYGFGTAKTIRAISFDNFNDAASASQDTSIVQLFGEVGYEVALDSITLEPFVDLAWTHLNAGAFRETGGSAALSGTSRDMDDAFSTLGLAASTPSFDLGGAALTLSLRAGWQHAFTNNTASRTLSFISTAQAFTALGTPLDADRAVIDVGAALALSGDTEVTLGCTGTLGTHSNDHALRVMGVFKL